MTLSPRHAKVREHRIAGTDAAKILNLSPWGNAHDVYLRLTDRLEVADIENPAMKLGKMMEGPLVDWAADEEGIKVRKNVIRAVGNLSAQIDAVAVGQPIGIEAKTAGSMDDWGDDGTDDIPAYYACQELHQAAVAKLDTVIMPVAFVGLHRAFKRYRCAISAEDRERYQAFMEEWFKRHILGDTPPDVAPSIDVAKLMKRVPGKVAIATSEQVEAWRYWRTARIARLKVADIEEQRKAAIMAAMGDAESIEYEGRRLTAKWIDVKEHMVKGSRYQKLTEGKAK